MRRDTSKKRQQAYEIRIRRATATARQNSLKLLELFPDESVSKLFLSNLMKVRATEYSEYY